MTDQSDDDGRSVLKSKHTRRGVLAGLATSSVIGMAVAANSEQTDALVGGSMLQDPHQVSDGLYVGPESAINSTPYEVAPDTGRVYKAADTQTEWYADGNTWTKLGVGSQESPVPSVHTEQVTLDAADSSFDDIVAELNAGKVVYAGPGTYSVNSASYSISGGQLIAHEDAVFDFSGQTYDSGPAVITWGGTPDPNNDQTTITADVAEGDASISVNDSSGFEAGDLAILRDDNTPNFGKSLMRRGEMVVVNSVPDSTTVEIAEGAYLSHSTGDTITLEPVDPVTGGWVGGEVDLTGTNITTDSKFLKHQWGRGFSIEDLTFTNGGGSSIHHHFEFESSYRSGIEGVETGRADDGDLGLLIQTGEATKYAYARNCTAYHGTASEFENDGLGPSIWAQYEDVVAVDGRFSINATAQEPEFVRCKARNMASDVAGFENQGVNPTFDRCQVWNSGGTGIQCKGIGERIIKPTLEDLGLGIRLGGNGDHPDQGSEEVVVTEPRIIDCGNGFNDTTGAAPLRLESPHIEYSTSTSGGDMPSVTVDGGYVLGSLLGGFECPELSVTGLEHDGDGDGKIVRATTPASKDEFVFSDVKTYNTGSNSAIRVSNLTKLVADNVRAVTGRAQVGHYLLRDGGSATITARGCDAENCGLSNGYDATIDHSDGTNIATDGTTI